MASTQLVMQAKGLVKRYGQVTALDGADFELRAGEILAVIGDNGAGKSSADQVPVGRDHPRRRRDPARRPADPLQEPDGCAPRRHRNGLPGPGRGPGDDHCREPVPRPRGAARGLPRQRAAHARQEEDAGDQHRAHERPEGRHPLDDAGGGDAVRRPAPVRGGGPRRGLCRARGHPRRADRGARREGRQHGARADPPRARQGPAGDPDQPQHAACVRDRRPHPRRAAGQARGDAEPEEDQHERHRGGDDRRDAAGDRSRPNAWPKGSGPC